MKQSLIKLIAPLAFSVSCLSGCMGIAGGGYTNSNNTTTNQNIAAYYNDIDLDQEGSFLLQELSQLCWDTHKVFVRYKQVNDYLKENSQHGSTDRIPSYKKTSNSDSKYNEMFYTGENGSVGTREHVWPCANSSNLWVHQSGQGGNADVDNDSYIGGGSDLFHIRPANTSVNTKRGNSKFVDFDDTDTVLEFDSTQINSYKPKTAKYTTYFYGDGADGFAKYCEPADEFKGDIARIYMYLYVHYSKISGVNVPSKYSYMVGNLSFTNVMGYKTLNKCYQVLVDWNEMDPPSEVEKNRNNVVQAVQGNRNPFIDYPELVSSCLLV